MPATAGCSGAVPPKWSTERCTPQRPPTGTPTATVVIMLVLEFGALSAFVWAFRVRASPGAGGSAVNPPRVRRFRAEGGQPR
jgi:hypothetical protein